MSGKYPGYTPDARDVGPQMFPRVVKPELSQAKLLLDQAKMTADPARQRELMYIAALEQKYAVKAAEGQQGVQNALLAPGLLRGDFIYGSPGQSMAKMNRGMIRDRAAQEYNNNLPIGYTGQRKDIGNPFYGA